MAFLGLTGTSGARRLTSRESLDPRSALVPALEDSLHVMCFQSVTAQIMSGRTYLQARRDSFRRKVITGGRKHRRQCLGILQTLAETLSLRWKHRVRGITNQNGSTFHPGRTYELDLLLLNANTLPVRQGPMVIQPPTSATDAQPQ